VNIIAICSALNNSYVAIKFKDIVESKILKSDDKNYHSLFILPQIKEMLQNKNLELKDFDAVAVNCGPGSFTGIRAALSIAKVIAGELNKPLIPLNTAEILLNAYKADILLMDARRDMYFVGDKDKIELILKDKLKIDSNKKIVADKRCADMFLNSTCFETIEKDLGLVMLELAENKYLVSKDKTEFNYLNVCANYIQTPPVF